MATPFTAYSFLGRWLFALVLVLGTYNPTAFSFVGWVFAENSQFGPFMALTGIGLLIAWIVFLRATFLSMGWLGIILVAALFAALSWLFVDIGWLRVDSTNAVAWLALIALSLILATGMSWSHIRRRLSGQYDIDDVED